VFVEIRVEYVHSRISLKPLITGVEQAKKLSNMFNSKANTTFSRILNGKIKGLVARTDKKLRSLHGREFRIYRDKRAIEFVGNLIAKLFGNPGPEDWRQNKKNVLAMKSAIERQLANSIIQHRDIDQNRHAINEQNEILKHVTKEIIGNENRINNVDNALTALENYLELETMHNSIDDILESLIDIKRDGKFGRCNEKGLNPEFLLDNLREIESNKNGIVPIFASWEWQSYYSHEMCSLAIHEGELWITMRIPIVNMAEQFVRTLPTNNQLWIRNELNELGMEIALFKNKNHESFMVLLKSNLELCSLLGTSRVCNVRSTKFREANPFIVPVDINFKRILLLANNSGSNEVKTICLKNVETANMTRHTVIKLPDMCSIISKSIEVGKLSTKTNLTLENKISEIERVELRQINKRINSTFSNLKDLEPLSTRFEANNNETEIILKNIKYNDYWSTKSLIITTGSSATVMTTIVILILIIFCVRKCKKRERDLVVKIERNQNKFDQSSNSEREIEEKNAYRSNMDFSCDTSDLEVDDKSKRVSSQFKKL